MLTRRVQTVTLQALGARGEVGYRVRLRLSQIRHLIGIADSVYKTRLCKNESFLCIFIRFRIYFKGYRLTDNFYSELVI